MADVLGKPVHTKLYCFNYDELITSIFSTNAMTGESTLSCQRKVFRDVILNDNEYFDKDRRFFTTKSKYWIVNHIFEIYRDNLLVAINIAVLEKDDLDVLIYGINEHYKCYGVSIGKSITRKLLTEWCRVRKLNGLSVD